MVWTSWGNKRNHKFISSTTGHDAKDTEWRRKSWQKCNRSYPDELLDNGEVYLESASVKVQHVIRCYQRFRFCGDLDAPDWLLAEIATISRMVCSQLGGWLHWDRVPWIPFDVLMNESIFSRRFGWKSSCAKLSLSWWKEISTMKR